MADMVKTYDKDGNVVMVDPNQKKPQFQPEYGVMEGYTPWGTKITDGRTTADYANEAKAKNDAFTSGIYSKYGIDPNAPRKKMTEYGVLEGFDPYGRKLPAGTTTEQWVAENNYTGRTDREKSPEEQNIFDQMLTDFAGRTGQSVDFFKDAWSKPKETVTDPRDVVVQDDTKIGTGEVVTPEVITPKDTEVAENPNGDTAYSGNSVLDGGYADQINTILAELTGDTFDYDPRTDTALKRAQEQVAQSVFEAMNDRGLFRSTFSQDRVTEVMQDLVPQYEQMAYDRYMQEKNNLYKLADLYGQVEEVRYAREVDKRNEEIRQAQVDLKAERQKIDDAWARTDLLGYVDNEASVVLGVPVGTPSQAVREMTLEQQFKLDIENAKLQGKLNDNLAENDKLTKGLKYNSVVEFVKQNITSGLFPTAEDASFILRSIKNNNQIMMQDKYINKYFPNIADKAILIDAIQTMTEDDFAKLNLNDVTGAFEDYQKEQDKIAEGKQFTFGMASDYVDQNIANIKWDGSYVWNDADVEKLFNWIDEVVESGNLSESEASRLLASYGFTSGGTGGDIKDDKANVGTGDLE